MISVKSSYRCGIEFAAFPDIIIDFYRMHDLHSGSSGIRMLLNRPDLDHWLLVVEKQVVLQEMIRWFDCNAYADMKPLFLIYTIIPAADRRALKRKMSGSVYFRPYYSASLRDLKWLSAKYVCVGTDQILFIPSPILIFDSSISDSLIDNWFHAFVSLLLTGFLDCIVSYTQFCLGSFKINLLDLTSK